MTTQTQTMTQAQALTIWAAARERARMIYWQKRPGYPVKGSPKKQSAAAWQLASFRSAPCRTGPRQPHAGSTRPEEPTSSAPLGDKQQLRLNRPDAGHQAVHLGHVDGLVLGGLGLLMRVGAVSLLVSGLSDLRVKRVPSGVQIAQLLGQPDPICGDEVPRRDHASSLRL